MRKIAIIDIGSNTIRMSLFNVDGDEFNELLNKKTTAGLASYVKKGFLSRDGIEKLLRILNGLIKTAKVLGFEEIKIFATASLRNILNIEEVKEILKREIDEPVEIVSGVDEAYFGYLGVKEKYDVSSGLIVDIGGGSTEITSIDAGKTVYNNSIPLGSLNLFKKYSSGIFIPKKSIERAEKYVVKKFEPIYSENLKSDELYGVGGTIRAVSNVIMEMKSLQSNKMIKSEFVFELYDKLKKKDKKTYEYVLKVSPERVHTIFPGTIILMEILRMSEAKTVYVSKFGVREGVLTNYLSEGRK